MEGDFKQSLLTISLLVLVQLLKLMQRGTKVDTKSVEWSKWVLQKCKRTQKIATHSLASYVCSFEVWKKKKGQCCQSPYICIPKKKKKKRKKGIHLSNWKCNIVISRSCPNSCMAVVETTVHWIKAHFIRETGKAMLQTKHVFWTPTMCLSQA